MAGRCLPLKREAEVIKEVLYVSWSAAPSVVDTGDFVSVIDEMAVDKAATTSDEGGLPVICFAKRFRYRGCLVRSAQSASNSFRSASDISSNISRRSYDSSQSG